MESDQKQKSVPENSETPNLTEKYAGIVNTYESFAQIASLGDINSIYRNRPCFANEKRRTTLVKPATDVFLEFPASRPAVFHFTGLLIHESIHHWFNKKENVQQLTSITIVKDSAIRLLDFYIKFYTDSDGKFGLEEVLQWICELCAEISTKNAGRPSMALSQQNSDILRILKSNDVIDKLLSLLNQVVTSLLEESPGTCMKALFEASRHGQHFSWIWLHVATLLQGNIITHLLEAGAEQFKTYVSEISSRKSLQNSAPAVLNIIQIEYEHKFRAISDVFNFLMAKRNPELQEAVSQLVLESLDCKVDRSNKSNRLGFAFFFKLVTCSRNTLKILITSNSHLITPFNVVRAIRQIQQVEKSLILPTTSFTDFIRQIVEEVDPVTHGIIFEILIELVYNQHVFDGEDLPEHHENNLKLSGECFPILDVMISRIIRIAHSAGAFKCPSQHPALSLCSSGQRLQSVINSIARHIDKTPSIIRHLHAISIAFGESKAAEIVLRLLMTISYNEPNYMYILMAYMSATVPYFPGMMSYMWREFGALKTLILMSFPSEQRRDHINSEIRIHQNLLHNIRTLLDWELSADNSEDPLAFSYWKIYPAEHIGAVLTQLLTESTKICWELQESKKTEETMKIYRFVTKLIESVCQSNSNYRNDKPVKNNRKILISLSELYKLMAQFAILLKSTLLLIGRENPDGIVIFEELRGQLLYFLFGNHLDPQMSKFSPIFVQLFVTACFVDSKRLFAENWSDPMESLIDESGLAKLMELTSLEDGPSVLESLNSIKMRDSYLDMLHTGQLKKRRKNQDFEEINGDSIEKEDATQRIHVVLDAIRLICTSGKLEIRISSSKQLALALVQTICQDSLMSEMRFDEWDLEADFIHRHVEVDRRMNQSTFCDGILRILAETRSFAYCMPIMKSRLAVLINETEKFPHRAKIGENCRQKLHTWIALAHKGGILPTRFVYIADLEQLATCHETYLMLLEVWRFLMCRNLTLPSIDNYQAELLRGDVDEGLPNEQESVEKINLTVFRVIIQNHFPKSVALFPKIFPADYEFLRLSKID